MQNQSKTEFKKHQSQAKTCTRAYNNNKKNSREMQYKY